MAKVEIQAAMAELGLTIESKFIPFSVSRNKGEKMPTLNWSVTLLRAGKPILTTDYGAGCAHAPSYQQSFKGETQLRVAYECEHGIKAGRVFYEGRENRVMAAPGRNKIEPDACDVVSSLVMDAGVLDAGSFEDWASEMGYDKDSRKAEATYRACLEIALKMRNGVGEDGLRKLQEACQDY